MIAKPSFGVTTYPFTASRFALLRFEDHVRRLNEVRIGCDRYPIGSRTSAAGASPTCCSNSSRPASPARSAAPGIRHPIRSAVRPRSLVRLKALRKLDFVVVVDTFQNPTSMALADVFLPASATGEKESFRNWWWPLTNSVRAVGFRAIPSPDSGVDFAMAKRVSERPIPYETVKDLVDDRLKPAGITFDELAERGTGLPYRGARASRTSGMSEACCAATASPASTRPAARWSCSLRDSRNGARDRSLSRRAAREPSLDT